MPHAVVREARSITLAGGQDFYRLKLRCFVELHLKIGEFKPEDASNMNVYLSVVGDRLPGRRGR